MTNDSIPKLSEPYKLRMETDVEAKLHAIMALTSESKPDALRRLLRNAVENELAEQSLGHMLPMIRRAVHESIRPTEERVAAISAKGAITSGTAMYMLLEVLGQLGRKDVRDLYQEARKKAIGQLRSKELNMSILEKENE